MKSEHEKIMEAEAERDKVEEPRVNKIKVTGTTVFNGFLYFLTLLTQMFSLASMPIGIIYTTFA